MQLDDDDDCCGDAFKGYRIKDIKVQNFGYLDVSIYCAYCEEVGQNLLLVKYPFLLDLSLIRIGFGPRHYESGTVVP